MTFWLNIAVPMACLNVFLMLSYIPVSFYFHVYKTQDKYISINFWISLNSTFSMQITVLRSFVGICCFSQGSTRRANPFFILCEFEEWLMKDALCRSSTSWTAARFSCTMESIFKTVFIWGSVNYYSLPHNSRDVWKCNETLLNIMPKHFLSNTNMYHVQPPVNPNLLLAGTLMVMLQLMSAL